MKKRKVFRKLTAIVLTMLMCISIVFPTMAVESAEEADYSAAAGYFYGDSFGMIIMQNGDVFLVDSQSLEKKKIEVEIVFLDNGADFILEDGSAAVYMKRQTEKGRTESGEAYYAMYEGFWGKSDEAEVIEGQNFQVGDYIFSITYRVVQRQPLARFFDFDDSSNVDSNSSDYQGPGFSSSEEAVQAFVKALKNCDLEEVISTFAVESYVDRYDTVKYINQTGGFEAFYSFIPTKGDMSEELNLLERVRSIYSNIRFIYLIMTGSTVMLDKISYLQKEIESEYGSVEAFLRERFARSEEDYFPNIEVGPTLSYEEICRMIEECTGREYESESTLKSLKRTREISGADAIDHAAQVFSVNGNTYMIIMETICYDGVWYNLSTISGPSYMLGLNSYTGGIIPVDEIDELAEYLERMENK